MGLQDPALLAAVTELEDVEKKLAANPGGGHERSVCVGVGGAFLAGFPQTHALCCAHLFVIRLTVDVLHTPALEMFLRGAEQLMPTRCPMMDCVSLCPWRHTLHLTCVLCPWPAVFQSERDKAKFAVFAKRAALGEKADGLRAALRSSQLTQFKEEVRGGGEGGGGGMGGW